MKIGELSKRSKVSVRMLRYYEAEGLLTPGRTESGYRVYGPMDEQCIARIQLLSSAGMTLATIKQFSACIRGDVPVFEPCDELRLTLRAQLQRIEQKAEHLRQQRVVLQRFIAEVES